MYILCKSNQLVGTIKLVSNYTINVNLASDDFYIPLDFSHHKQWTPKNYGVGCIIGPRAATVMGHINRSTLAQSRHVCRQISNRAGALNIAMGHSHPVFIYNQPQISCPTTPSLCGEEELIDTRNRSSEYPGASAESPSLIHIHFPEHNPVHFSWDAGRVGDKKMDVCFHCRPQGKKMLHYIS